MDEPVHGPPWPPESWIPHPVSDSSDYLDAKRDVPVESLSPEDNAAYDAWLPKHEARIAALRAEGILGPPEPPWSPEPVPQEPKPKRGRRREPQP